MSKVTGFTTADVDTLDADQRRIMYERYTMIAPILSFVADEKVRSQLICSTAKDVVPLIVLQSVSGNVEVLHLPRLTVEITKLIK